ncbi:glutathione-disulfide reductase [Prochlorothrix hollandica]|uniref:glutathione-disulfide reductase n=1 Tax=Prochlorothrix hollandica TaxID=1223 RepID=UPI003341940B
MTFDYDLFVLGAGSGGLAASKRAASYGAKVAIAEQDLVGGTCVIRGCVPKKLMVYASHFSHFYQDAVGYGWSPVEATFDWSKLVQAVDGEVRRLSRLHISFLEKNNVELFHGQARLVDDHTVAVDDRTFTAEKILIAVGGEATKPQIPGIEHAITSREVFLLPLQPKRLAVVGGGYIGTEFAGVFNGLGTEVFQVVRRGLILRGFDEDLREEVQTGMVKKGVNVLSNTTIEKIEKVPEGVRLVLKGAKDNSLVVDTVLYATGRSPNLEGLGLETAGVETAKGAIVVNEWSQTSQPHIFALGDCTDKVNLTPVAVAEGRAFADTQFGNKPHHISYENIATAVFSQPEACTVGMTEIAANAQYGEDGVKVYRTRFRPMIYALPNVDEKILMKLVVHKETDRVLGAQMVGKDAAEIIQCVAIAVTMGATKKDFDATMALHPTSAEEFVTLP